MYKTESNRLIYGGISLFFILTLSELNPNYIQHPQLCLFKWIETLKESRFQADKNKKQYLLIV